MARVLTLAHAPSRQFQQDTLRGAIVIGCALALIAAGQAFPFAAF